MNTKKNTPITLIPITDDQCPCKLKPRYFLTGLASLALAIAVATPFTSLLAQETVSSGKEKELLPDQIPLYDTVPDPLEGFNRCSWTFNEWLFRWLFHPLSVGYTFVVPKPVRSDISNAGHNLTYPVRLFNNCFQGKWDGAWAETERFGVNSTVGVGGLFDPATHWKIGQSEEDFGQTLGHYGSGPGFYLVLPVIGPSNGRDAVGKVVDTPLDPSFWVGVAYPHELWPDAIRPGFGFNDLSGKAGDCKRQLDSLVDPYDAARAIYSLNRARLITDYRPDAKGNYNPEPTIRAVLFKPVTPDFADEAITRKVLIPATGKKLAYSCWMQKKPAPLVCYIPGLGAYRLDRSALAYADMMYRHGYSVLVFSNPFQQEFMDHAATVAIPGYGPADCDDVVNALKLVLGDVRKWQGNKITTTSLTGVSHGGYFTLMIAARETAGKLDGLGFDRYVAVNPPVNLIQAMNRLDDMFNAPLNWPVDERWQRMKEAFYKALYFADNNLDVSGNIPLTRDESRFLIGLAFRVTLASVIVDSQQRKNLGILKADPTQFVRRDSYREIRQISYADYENRFMLPYLKNTGRGADREALLAATDLKQSTALLRNNPKVRVQICEDDFLLNVADVAWFRSTFGTNLTAYPSGGHLGNLHVPAVQESLVGLFSNEPTK